MGVLQVLSATTHKLRAVVNANATTNESRVVVNYAVQTSAAPHTPTAAVQTTNGTTAVDLLGAPASGEERSITNVVIWNRDTVDHTYTVYLDVSGTEYDLYTAQQIKAGKTAILSVSGAGGASLTSPLTTKGDIWVYSSTDARLGVGTDGKYLKADSSTGTGLAYGNSVSVAIYEEQLTAGTNGGTFSSGAERTRLLSTEVSDPDNIASLDTGTHQVTITNAGVYVIEWWATGYTVNSHQSVLYDITGAADYKSGSSEFSGSTTGVETKSVGMYILTLSASRVLELRGICQTTGTFGLAANLGKTEVYSQLVIRKIG